MSTRNLKHEVEAQLAEGNFVKVAGAENQAEAEFLQGLLREEGVPSSLRRARGFDVPDFLAAGPRDVLVAQSDVRVARDLLQADGGTLVPDSAVGSPRRCGCLRALSSPWRWWRSSSGSAPSSSYRRRRCTGYSAADRAPARCQAI
jgi:hypothetical protein